MKLVIAGLAFCWGLALTAYGFWLAWHPLGFIVGGFVLAIGAVLFERGAADRGRKH